VTIGMSMTYEGKRDRESGRILAERVEFSTNDLEDGEGRLWKSLKTSIRTAQGLKPGELKIDRIGKFRLLPNAQVQEYVASVGRSLIPAYEARMTDDDPRKIPFQFHVVVDESVNAFATPNGIVVVNSGLLELLENEAQLAAVVGHEIAHSTHEHTWRQQQYHKKKRIGIAIAGALASAYGMPSLANMATLVNAAIVSGHARDLENQSDRIGLQYMMEARYDPREAPTVWKLMAKKNGVSATNVFWSNHDNEATRRSYLMNELKNNYRDVDYTQLRVNAAEYSTMKAAVIAANGKKTKIKVTR
jgi:predicted Zn-dependent protease